MTKMKLLAVAMTLSVGIANASAAKPWNYMLGEQNPYPAPVSESFVEAPDGYEFVTMSYFTRHASRYALDENLLPTTLSEMQALGRKGRITEKGATLFKNIEAFNQWWGENSDRLGNTTALGFSEMENMGRRGVSMVQVEAGRFIGEPIRVRTKSSGAVRTLESQSAYLYGAMNQAALNGQHPLKIENEDSLENRAIADPHHFYGYHWSTRVPLEAKARELIEARLQELPDTVVDFTSELVADLTKEESARFTSALFKLCQQDAPQGMERGMCQPFKDWVAQGGDTGVMDYFFELNQIDKFYNFGPSVEADGAARQMGMPVVAEFMRTMTEAVESPETAPHMNLVFGHDAGVIAMLSALDLMVTEGTQEERTTNFMPYRDFPMGSNIIWQMYRKGDDYQVRMLHNERPVSFNIEGCQNQPMCSWTKVKEQYSQQEYTVMPEIIPDPNTGNLVSDPQMNLIPTF